MFTGNVMLLPGKEIKQFTVLVPDTRKNSAGRGTITGYQPVGIIKAILAQAKPDEVQRWKQLTHPVSHKIIMQYKPSFDIRPGDIFEMVGRDEADKRHFYMEAMPYNPGNLGHYTIFYCNERADVAWSSRM